MPLEQQEAGERLSAEDLREAWLLFAPEDRRLGFEQLPRSEAEDFFLSLPARDQEELVLGLPRDARRSWVRLLPPDDAADLIQAAAPEEREGLLALLDDATRREVTALLAYAEDEAGGLMNPRFARIRPDATVDEAISYLRRQAREANAEVIYYAYVLDEEQRLLGVASFRDLFAASPEKRVRDVMHTDIVSVTEDMDQEAVSHVFADHDLPAIPVVDAQGRMKGIVTVDDIVDVVEEEATEDIQKFGGVEVLGAPYLDMGFGAMVRKRGGWLAALFIGEMLTATAMAFFEDEIARAVVLAVFLPLIISSGGNSGSQASTLVIRAMALGEVRVRDWWRVAGREVTTGLALGVLLATIGFVRILVWQRIGHMYGEHYLRVALTVSVSLVGVVTFGTLAGSMLPFLLRRFGLDPASASAPFVATLVDVTGLVIYFAVGSVFLSGALL
ncbi:MAG TPA: magnesium transporter [Anaeromyxobacter sp.]